MTMAANVFEPAIERRAYLRSRIQLSMAPRVPSVDDDSRLRVGTAGRRSGMTSASRHAGPAAGARDVAPDAHRGVPRRDGLEPDRPAAFRIQTIADLLVVLLEGLLVHDPRASAIARMRSVRW